LLAFLPEAVEKLRAHIRLHHGRNAADVSFRRQVEELISSFYDDIDVIVQIPLRSFFQLLVIKALYVDRASTDADVIDYLSDMLTRYLYARELFPFLGKGGGARPFYFSYLLEEMQQGLRHFQNLFEACRRYGDNALFLTGIFPQFFRRRSRSGAFPEPSYYISTGKSCYHMAAQHELAQVTQLRPALLQLARHFETYMLALNDISQRYIMGLDMNLLADKMLDAFNLWRQTGDEHHLEKARRYAALLKVDSTRFPSLFQRGRYRSHN